MLQQEFQEGSAEQQSWLVLDKRRWHEASERIGSNSFGDLARLSGIPKSTLRLTYFGYLPPANDRAKIAAALQLSPSELFIVIKK